MLDDDNEDKAKRPEEHSRQEQRNTLKIKAVRAYWGIFLKTGEEMKL